MYVWAGKALGGLGEWMPDVEDPLGTDPPRVSEAVHEALVEAVTGKRVAIVLANTAENIATNLYVLYEPLADLVVAIGVDRTFSLTATQGLPIWPRLEALQAQLVQRLASAEPVEQVLAFVAERVRPLSVLSTSDDDLSTSDDDLDE